MMSNPRHLVITGASSGIGAALVRYALEQGWQVSGIARRNERMEQLANELGELSSRFSWFQGDVCDSESLNKAMELAVTSRGPFDGVVANAGRGVDGELLEISPSDLAAVYDSNVTGVHRTLLAAQDRMATRGAFVAVSSVAAFLPIPRMGAYCATKHALEAWAAAARMELDDKDLRVMTCCPGTVRTEFFEAAPKPGKVWDWRPGSALQASQVAKVIFKQVRRRGPNRRIIPWFARGTANIYMIWPSLVEWTMRKALKAMRNKQ